MKLLSYADLAQKFQNYVAEAKSIDMALAWAGLSPSLMFLSEQAQQRQLAVRAIVGIDTYYSHPLALDALHSLGQLRVIKCANGLFHPKMYIFHLQQKTVVWVGSANFTRHGFHYNEELVAEMEEENADAVNWFEHRWSDIDAHESLILMSEYSQKWHPPITDHAPSITDQSNEYDTNINCDWELYVTQLKARDVHWKNKSSQMRYPFSVLGETNSYLSSIAEGQIVARRHTWDDLKHKDAVILLGLSDEFGVNGLLGSMRGAGFASHVFLKRSSTNIAIRNRIHAAIAATAGIEDQTAYVDAASEAIAIVSSIKHFSIGMATRLLALTRPDRAISVNKAAAQGLSQLSGFKVATILNPNKYAQLLTWLYQLEWYQTQLPPTPFEQVIWNNRAALIDAFVYDNRSSLTSQGYRT